MVVEEALAEIELEVFVGHVAGREGDFGELVGVVDDGELGFQIEVKPWDGVPGEFVVEVGDITVEFWIFAKDVDVGVEAEPFVSAAITACEEAVSGSEAENGPVF